MNQLDRLAYRPADAAAALGISRSRLYELMSAGKITGRKISLQVTVITRAELERYLDELPVADVAGSKDRAPPDPREQRSA